MKKIILAVSMLVAMAVVFGLPSIVMAGIPPVSCTTDADCDDINDCTDDTCDVGETDECVFTNNDTNACDDGDVCTNDACMSGACTGTLIDCNDGDACTTDLCISLLGCATIPTICDDTIACTDDSCDQMAGCMNAPDCSLDPSCDLGSGPGCSAIGGVDATTIMAGNCFTGKIGTTGVSGVNPNGRPATDTDGDGCTDSLEKCINSSLVGFCSDVDVDDCDSDPGDGGEDIIYIPGATEGNKNSQQNFEVIFQSGPCAISECSDHMDNEATPDGLIDYPNDPQCDSFSDDDESSQEH